MCCGLPPRWGAVMTTDTICPFILSLGGPSWTGCLTQLERVFSVSSRDWLRKDRYGPAIEIQRQGGTFRIGFAARYWAPSRNDSRNSGPRLQHMGSRMTESPLDGEDCETWAYQSPRQIVGGPIPSPHLLCRTRAISEWQSPGRRVVSARSRTDPSPMTVFRLLPLRSVYQLD